MEIRELAERILSATTLDDKLRRAAGPITDDRPGPATRICMPARPAGLEIAAGRRAPAMPHRTALADPAKRAIAHHIMANHELQACEVMAYVLIAFPDAAAEFRQGLVDIIDDEQRHTRMHVERAAALGLRFGALPVNGYIWKKAQGFTTVLDYLAGLSLTFESGNLDHTLEFEEHFLRAGDERSAAVLRAIHRDEIRHVAFGLQWLRRLKPPGLSDWDAYESHLKWPLRPAKAKGDRFHRGPRREAGMSDDFIDRLEAACDEGP
jgi:uncharacterized ferritin-like protein (DUF455 family)